MPSITLHDVATSGHLIGVACERCMRHTTFAEVKVKAKAGDTRTLEEAGLYCGKCGSRRFTATCFRTRSAAGAFMRNL